MQLKVILIIWLNISELAEECDYEFGVEFNDDFSCTIWIKNPNYNEAVA